jgi:hypothetical protein
MRASKQSSSTQHAVKHASAERGRTTHRPNDQKVTYLFGKLAVTIDKTTMFGESSAERKTVLTDTNQG